MKKLLVSLVLALALASVARAADGDLVYQANPMLHYKVVDGATSTTVGVYVDTRTCVWMRIGCNAADAIVLVDGRDDTTKPAGSAVGLNFGSNTALVGGPTALTLSGTTAGAAVPAWTKASVGTYNAGTVNCWLLCRRAAGR